MSKAPLRLGFTDTIPPVEEFFTKQLSLIFNVIRDDNNPDYLIFGDRNFGERNLLHKDCVKIFYTGENQRPWDYDCHYAITFDHYDDSRHYRLPLYVIYDHDSRNRGGPTWDQRYLYIEDLESRWDHLGFCSFVVKNGSCKRRNDFFHKLSEYKKVDSGGPLFNNIGYILERDGVAQVETKLKFLQKYKFNLCFENASYPGYATEKCYDALVVGTMPIYWGSPTIEVDFNTNCFLNWHDYKDDRIFIQAIEYYDQHKNEYLDKIQKRMFHGPPPNKFFSMDLFRMWFSTNVYQGSR